MVARQLQLVERGTGKVCRSKTGVLLLRHAANPSAVAIVQSANDESVVKLFQHLSIDVFTPQLEETAAGELADMRLKCQLGISLHAQVAHNGRRLHDIGSFR